MVIDQDNIIWRELLSSDQQILIVLGDHHFFSEYDIESGKWRYIRDLTINSDEDFEYFKNQYPNKLLKNTADSYFPDGSIWSLPPLLYMLHPLQKKIALNKMMAKDNSGSATSLRIRERPCAWSNAA